MKKKTKKLEKSKVKKGEGKFTNRLFRNVKWCQDDKRCFCEGIMKSAM